MREPGNEVARVQRTQKVVGGGNSQKVISRGTEILFYECGLEFVSLLRGTNSHIAHHHIFGLSTL